MGVINRQVGQTRERTSQIGTLSPVSLEGMGITGLE
jgi:hypothetical protein